MELALVLRELWGRKRLLGLGFLIAVVAATMSVYRLDGLTLKPRSLTYSAGSTQVLVDQSSTVLGNSSQIFDGPDARATVFANFMTSPAVLAVIGQKAGIPGDQIYAAGPVNPNVPRVVQEPTAGERNVELTGETDPYQLTLNADPDLPIIDVYSQAPTTNQAIALANGAVTGLNQYLTNLENADNIRSSNRVILHQLGPATGGVVNGGIRKSLAGGVFFAVFVLWCILILVGTRFRENWRASGSIYDHGPLPHGRMHETNGHLSETNGHLPETADHRLIQHPTQPPALEASKSNGHGPRVVVTRRSQHAAPGDADPSAETPPAQSAG